MPEANAHRRRFAISLVAFVLLATVVALLGAPSGAPAIAAAPLGPSSPAGDISNGWSEVLSVSPYPDGASFHFYGMTFASRDVGFAYGGDTWYPQTNPGRVYRTKDGGATWQLVLENRGWKIGMACSDELHCWVGGRYGQVYYTNDGGDHWLGASEYTWQGMENWPTPPVHTPTPFTAWIRSAGIGPGGSPVLFGATDNTILHSSDGVNFYNYWPMLSWSVATWSVACPSSTICYGGQINRFIVKSTDGGGSWTMPAFASDYSSNCLADKYPNPDPGAAGGIQRRYYGLAFLDTNYGWAVGSCGMIFRTRNGAASRWERQMPSLSEEVQLRAIQAFSTKSAIAAGGDTPDPNDPSEATHAVIYRTTDGVTWNPVAAPETKELHGIAAFGDATFVADWSGRIWRWDGALVSIPDNTATPSPTPASGNTETPTATPTAAATATPTETPTATPTAVPATGSIEVVAFSDVNLDGKPNQDELLQGAEFQVSKDSTPVATGVTGAYGSYVFANLNPGAYEVDETKPPQGYTPNHTSMYVGLEKGAALVLPFSHRMSTQTPEPTATPTATAETHRIWLPLVTQ